MPDIEFIIGEEFKGSYPEPVPAHLALPQWVKDQPNKLDRKLAGPTTPGVSTYKRCVPFMDIMRTGYIIPMWTDVAFSFNECPGDCDLGTKCPGGEVHVEWPRTGEPANRPHIESRGWDSWGNIPELETSISHTSMTFVNPWIMKTPPGYSTLITAPFNDESRPHPSIKTLTGLVNTDTYFNQTTFFFHMKEAFNGILKKGTPLVQVVPIKREEWESKVTYMRPGDENDTKHTQELTYLSTKYVDAYRDRHGCPVSFR